MFKIVSISLIILFLSLPETQGQKNIKGSGYILTQQRKLASFHSIEVSRGIEVFIGQDEFQPVIVEADDNLFPYIKTIVHDGVLKIYISDTINITRYADMNILISIPSFVTLRATDGACIDGSTNIWELGNLTLRAETGGRIKLNIKTLSTQIEATTSATVDLKGQTRQLEAVLKTGARLTARHLEANQAQLQITIQAKAEVEVSKDIEYELSGNAQLTLHGNPMINKSQIYSGGKVTHEK